MASSKLFFLEDSVPVLPTNFSVVREHDPKAKNRLTAKFSERQ
ncbi:MAG: hypothetical protein DFNUSKGM_001021 [Candidatus Fervidibacter sacchari]